MDWESVEVAAGATETILTITPGEGYYAHLYGMAIQTTRPSKQLSHERQVEIGGLPISSDPKITGTYLLLDDTITVKAGNGTVRAEIVELNYTRGLRGIITLSFTNTGTETVTVTAFIDYAIEAEH
jgi:hypothetical protein